MHFWRDLNSNRRVILELRVQGFSVSLRWGGGGGSEPCEQTLLYGFWEPAQVTIISIQGLCGLHCGFQFKGLSLEFRA